jgi:hypothetical protein
MALVLAAQPAMKTVTADSIGFIGQMGAHDFIKMLILP